MTRLSARLAPTFETPTSFTLPAGKTIGRGWLRRGRRILLAQRQLPFEIGDPFLLFRVLLSESLVFLSQALEFVWPPCHLIDISARFRLSWRPPSRRHARYGTPIGSTCTDS
jgi:hypothetical protein